MPEEEQYILRPFKSADEPFIYSTWMKGFYFGNSLFKFWNISEKKYNEKYRLIIQKILNNPNVYVTCACLMDDPDIILAYSVIEQIHEGKASLHWIFTKTGFRGLGLAQKLLPKDIEEFTHLTEVGKSLLPSHWVFNPFII